MCQWNARFNEGAHFQYNRGRSSYMMEHNLQGLAYLLAAGWQSDEKLKRLFTGVATMVPGGGGGGGQCPLTFVLF